MPDHTLPFLAAIALAGVGYALADAVVSRSTRFRRARIAAPLLGGAVLAVAFALLHVLGFRVGVPTSGARMDFLVGLLTTNMGLHVTPKVLREGWRAFLLFALGGLALALALALAVFTATPVATALIAGPVSFVGAPFNLNPPEQMKILAPFLAPAYPHAPNVAQGVMMLGVIAALILPGPLGARLERTHGAGRASTSPVREDERVHPWALADDLTKVFALVLVLIVLAFMAQRALLATFPGLTPSLAPVILISYLLGAAFRIVFERATRHHDAAFPKTALRLLLLGPTMGFVLTYAVMAVPLHMLTEVTPVLTAGALLAIAASVIAARLMFTVFARVLDPYYATVVATAFLAVTTAWGPVGMAYLRRFTGEEAPVEPMPVILPVNAFYVFPWMMIGLTALVVRVTS